MLQGMLGIGHGTAWMMVFGSAFVIMWPLICICIKQLTIGSKEEVYVEQDVGIIDLMDSPIIGQYQLEREAMDRYIEGSVDGVYIKDIINGIGRDIDMDVVRDVITNG